MSSDSSIVVQLTTLTSKSSNCFSTSFQNGVPAAMHVIKNSQHSCVVKLQLQTLFCCSLIAAILEACLWKHEKSCGCTVAIQLQSSATCSDLCDLAVRQT